MKKVCLLLTFFLIFNGTGAVFAAENLEKTIPLSHFFGIDTQAVTGVQIYIAGENYEVDINQFFEIADQCMMTLSPEPQPISYDGLYIGVLTDDFVSCAYISRDGGVDNAVPGAGRQLKAVYTFDDVSYVDKIMSLVPAISLSGATEVDSISDWAKDSAKKAEALHIAEEGRNYHYPQPVTREEFCELIYNLILCVNGSITVSDENVMFTDTDNQKVHALNQAGIITGKSETEFAPDDALTREEAAAILVRMINREMPMPATEMWFAFDDAAEISQWASDAVQTICNLGFMVGVGGNKFAPRDAYTVEQAMVTLVRIYEAT